MPTDVVMPQMGESIFEGTITKWLKKAGDAVREDEPLFEISTDKVDAEIPSPGGGRAGGDQGARGRDGPDQYGGSGSSGERNSGTEARDGTVCACWRQRPAKSAEPASATPAGATRRKQPRKCRKGPTW